MAIIHIHSRVYIALSTIQEAKNCNALNPAIFLSGGCDILDEADPENTDSINPQTLAEIYKCSETLQRTLCHHAKENIVICVGTDPEFLTNVSLILGGYLILGHNVDFNHLKSVFDSIARARSVLSRAQASKSQERNIF